MRIFEMPKYNQGIFKPKNPQKYKGDPTRIEYRSGWELRVMSHFDLHPDVLWWSSEERIIPYRSPIDNKVHRYFPDFLIHIKTIQGTTETVLIEVKPKAQTRPPVMSESTKRSKRYLSEVMTWGVNEAKWKAADEYCKDRGYRFMIMTEDHIFGNTNK
jgi:hypothetical protein